MIFDLGRTWKLLESEGVRGRALAIRETDVRTAFGAVCAAVDSSRQRMLLIPISPESGVGEDVTSAGIHAVRDEFVDKGERRQFLKICCLMPDLNKTFTDLADDLLQVLREDSGDAPQTCLSVLAVWRELIQRESAGGLTETALAGVFGELHVLSQLVSLSPSAVELWTGPLGLEHDFIGKTASLEVKCIRQRRTIRLRISSLQQLTPLNNRRLHLAVVRICRVPAGGTSIGELVEAIERISGKGDVFRERLQSCGLTEALKGMWSKVRYDVREQIFYRVDEKFPKIVAASFMDGGMPEKVTELEYVVDLSFPPPSAIALEDVAPMLHMLVES